MVTAAINDFGLSVSNYLMLDAAMPMEAFDNSSSVFPNTNMVFTGYAPSSVITWVEGVIVPTVPDPGWKNYNTSLWASYWYNLFPANDARHKLTWQNRFPNVTAVNYYSTGE